MYDPALFFPKALISACMAGLLTYPGFLKPSHRAKAPQWQVFQITIIPRYAGSGITAAGTVADSNRIPFSLQ